MRSAAYAPVSRADRLLAAADELQAAALDLVDEWAEAEWVGDASTGPTGEAIRFLMVAENLAELAVEIADSRREA
jgi:hypothetical protein